MAGRWPRISPVSVVADHVSDADALARVIRRRRMTRTFAGPAPIDVVTAACDLARRAPSAGFSQGSHFLVLAGPELGAFWSVSGAGEWFTRTSPGVLAADPVVVVLGDRAAYTERYSEADKAGHGLEDAAAWPVPYWSTDAAMAAENLLLLLEAEGLGALFFGLFGDVRGTLRHFGVPESVEFVGAVAIGSRAEDDRPSGSSTTRSRKSRSAVIHVGRW